MAHPDNIVELINGGDYNPYHLFFYMISNFRMIDCNQPVIYYYPKSECRLAEEVLSMLPSHFIRHTEKDSTLQYRPFLHTTPFKVQRPFFPDWTLPYDYDFLRQLFAPHYAKQVTKGLRIYISRRDAKSRRPVNEDEVLAALLPLNFIPVTLTDLSVAEQMQVFSRADIIVAPHGAGLAFMTFCNQDTTVIELNTCMKEKRHYSHIAWHLDLDYYKIVCKSVGENEDMYVPVANLTSFLTSHPKAKL